MVGDDPYEEGTFFHSLTNEELNVQLGEGFLFLTYYSGSGKARAKKVLDLSKVSSEEIHKLLEFYQKAV